MCFVGAGALTGIYETYAILNINGTGNVYYDAGANTANPDLQGASLGTVSSLILNGGEMKTYKNGVGDVYGAYLAYRVWSGSPSGSFTETQLPWSADLGLGNQDWSATNANINLLQGLSSGNYTLEIYFRSPGNQGDVYDNGGNSSLNYRATFDVTPVPEPITLALPIFGGLVAIAGLSRRSFSGFRPRSGTGVPPVCPIQINALRPSETHGRDAPWRQVH
jgi:hypothetical protein